jgi:hypothetical protein
LESTVDLLEKCVVKDPQQFPLECHAKKLVWDELTKKLSKKYLFGGCVAQCTVGRDSSISSSTSSTAS